MNKEKVINELIEFVEGRMSFKEFQQNYETNKDYFKLLEDTKPNDSFQYQKNKSINQCLKFYKWSTALGQNVVHSYIVRYLKYYHFKIQPTEEYHNKVKFISDIQPSYVSIEDEEFLNKIIGEAPKDISKTNQKKWLKDRIRNIFRYDSNPPKWIQDPEWPIVDGKPLVFKGQTKQKIDDERVYYTFYNPETKEEKVIVQFY